MLATVRKPVLVVGISINETVRVKVSSPVKSAATAIMPTKTPPIILLAVPRVRLVGVLSRRLSSQTFGSRDKPLPSGMGSLDVFVVIRLGNSLFAADEMEQGQH